jgi:hypothetical protein
MTFDSTFDSVPALACDAPGQDILLLWRAYAGTELIEGQIAGHDASGHGLEEEQGAVPTATHTKKYDAEHQ